MNDITQKDEFGQSRILALKNEMHEASRSAGIIRDQGPLLGLSAEVSWQGNISLSERIDSGELSKSKVDLAVESLSDFYAPAKSSSRIRCIDGRILKGYDDNSVEWLLKDLGPQVPGGTAAQSFCYRMAEGPSINFGRQTQAEDMQTMAKIVDTTGFIAGNHSDSKNYHTKIGKTGCGAVDTTLQQLKLVISGADSGVKQLTSSLLGDDFDPAKYDFVVNSGTNLHREYERYFLSKQDLFDEFQKENPDAIAVLDGSHNEILMSINNVEETTLNRDHFSSVHDNTIQAFNYDIWYERRVAEAISDDKSIQARFLHARVATAVATLILLTDGTPHLYIREPQNRLN